MDKDMSRALRRAIDKKKALRKRTISREVYHYDWYNNLHEYSKNKIHCSCPSCSGMAKTNQKKFKGAGQRCKPWVSRVSHWGSTNYRHGKNWARPELKRIQSMADDLKEFEKN